MKHLYSEIHGVAKTFEDTVVATDKIIGPVRESFFKRFPTTSILLVTFGVSATIFGIERFISEVPWLNERPLLIIMVGVGMLLLTGRLYKKLG
jgi:hypothetical protein